MVKLFYGVIDMSIAASWLIMAIIVLRIFLKRLPRKITCFLWALVAIRLVCPLAVESPFSLVPDIQGRVLGYADTSDNTIQDSYDVKLPDYTGNSAKDMSGYTDNVSVTQNTDSENSQNNIKNDINTSDLSDIFQNDAGNEDINADAVRNGKSLKNITDIIFNVKLSNGFIKNIVPIWVGGVVLMLAYASVSYILIRRRTGISVNIEKNIYICDDIATPFVLGTFVPKIYLPSSLTDSQKVYVIAHENAHLKRLDNIWKPLGYIILSVYWFNPFVWAAYILFCRDIEIACDEKVVADKDMEYKKQYAMTLLSCSAPGKVVSACPIAFGETGVKTRIKTVLNYRKPAFWLVLVGAIACLAVVLCFMTNPKSGQSEVTNQEEITETADEGTDEIISESINESPDESADTKSDIPETESEQQTEELSYIERFNQEYYKIDFLNYIVFDSDGNMIEYEGHMKNAFDCLAQEAREEDTQLYDALHDPVTSVCTLLGLEYDNYEIHHSDVLGIIYLKLELTGGEEKIYEMENRGELWQPVYEMRTREVYEKSANTEQYINELTADKLRSEALKLEDYTVDDYQKENVVFILDEVEGEDITLYGLGGGLAMLLRDGEDVLPIWLAWMSPHMWIPQIYFADYDNDGKMEYALKTHMNTGSGVSGDELYFIETDWEKNEDSQVEYAINEFKYYDWIEQLDVIGYEFDEESKVLTITLNGEAVAQTDISALLESYGADFNGFGFGDHNTFDEKDGQWYINAYSGIFLEGHATPKAECKIIADARVIYEEDGSCHMEDISVSVENALE